ncbi:MAG: hypothetical protein U1E56_09180 [Bauldia sp.]
MGDEVAKADFAPADFDAFAARLAAETADLGRMWNDGAFADSGFSIGCEIEAWLLDHAYYPAPVNQAFLAKADHPLVVPELSRFNIELNCTPLPLAGDVFARMAAELTGLWAHCETVAHGLDANAVLIGTLPVIRNADLSLANISPLKRYAALNREILRRRDGRPVRVEISGREALAVEHRDVMLEAATTSFQVHLKVPAARAHLYWNASAMAAGPLLAAAGNAPFLFGRDLWDETRIPLFEQAIDLPGAGGLARVGFGSGYVERSLVEMFAENLRAFPPLLPLLFDDASEALPHLRLHNGTIWRWNRPLLGTDADGRPHLRIEYRTLPAGPTLADMLANAAAYVGLVHELVERGMAERPAVPFAAARANFYAAARLGLAALTVWPGAAEGTAATLLAERLLPMARSGLSRLRLAPDADRLIDLVEQRVAGGQTGAAWQRAALAARGGDFRAIMAAYCERQRSASPVFQWDV